MPSKYTGIALFKLVSALDEADRILSIPSYKPENDIFLSLVHAYQTAYMYVPAVIIWRFMST